MLAAALVGATAILPDMMNLHRERTAQGVTVVVAPGDGPVTVEAWIGGGLGDEHEDGEGGATSGMAHLGEHVALATASATAMGRVGLDGWVTPDATVFRAIAPVGEVDAAIATIARIATIASAGDVRGALSGQVSEWIVEREKERIAREGAGAGGVVARGGVREIAAWWRQSYSPARTTVAVRGARVEEAVAAVGRGWRGAGRGARSSGFGARSSGHRTRSTEYGARSTGHRAGPMAIDVSGANERERAALSIAAAAMRARGVCADLVVTRDAIMWIANSALDGFWLDEAALAWARVAVRVPIAGVETTIGEIAAGQHLFGDPVWSARWRREIAAVSTADVRAAVGAHVVGPAMRTQIAGGVVRAARPSPAPPRRRPTPPLRGRAAARVVKRATLANGARVIAVRVPGAERVAVRVAWAGGFAAEGPADRGVVALLAAAAPTECAEIDVAAETAALGGELAGVAGRWAFGLRSRWTQVAWKDGLALVAMCARAPALDHDVVARERARLVDLATGVALSPSRIAFTTYLRARWGADPLGIDALAAPGELATITRADAAQWWRDHYALGAAVIVVAGDVDPDAAIAEVREGFEAPSGAPAPRPPAIATAPSLPERRQLFVDGPGANTALVVGLPGLAAGDADRRALGGLVAILADPAGRLRRAATAHGVRSVRVTAVDGPVTGYVVIALDGAAPADAALVAVEAVVRALGTEGPTAAEVAVAEAALAPSDEPLTIADDTARAELFAPVESATTAADIAAPLDAATLQRVAASVLRWDDAMVVTVRPPAMTPGARAHANKRLPPHRTRRGNRR